MNWIWENKQWPQFEWNMDELLAPVCEVRQMLGELNGVLKGLGIHAEMDASLSANVQNVLRSSEIEGVMLSPEQVRSSIAWRLGLPNEGMPVASHYIEGLVDMMVDACNNCHLPMTEERLMKWHQMIVLAGESGVYRHSSAPMCVISGVLGNETVHYEAPPSDVVPTMMNALIKYINNEDNIEPIIKAAICSFWFVTIHPFNDGNGRISRTIADMMLARADGMRQRVYSLSAEIQKKRASYYQILERTQSGCMNITPWIKWFVQCLRAAVQTSLDQVQIVLKKVQFWESYCDLNINARQKKVVDMLLTHFEGKLTTAKYAKIAKCSNDTALRDLQFLVSCHILRSEGSGRGSHYVLNE